MMRNNRLLGVIALLGSTVGLTMSPDSLVVPREPYPAKPRGSKVKRQFACNAGSGLSRRVARRQAGHFVRGGGL